MENSNDSLINNTTTTTPKTIIDKTQIASKNNMTQQNIPESVTTISAATTTNCIKTELSSPCTTTTPPTDSTVIKKREKFSKDSNGERIRDEKGYRLRAAGLCTRINNKNMIELLLVSGRGNSSSWVLPGGGIEEAENAQQAAIREVHEEAGIRATIRSMVGEFKDDERLNRTILYEMNVIEEYEDWEDGRNGRLRSWFTIPEALEKIKSSQRVMLQKYISD